MASDVPAISPPPPAGATTASGRQPRALHCLTISCPTVPCPAMTSKIVIGLDQRRTTLRRDALAERLARLAGSVVEHDLRPVAAGARNLHRRRVPRHDDDRGHADELGRSRDGLSMIAGGVGHHAAGLCARVELQQPVAGAPKLERAGALERLRLEQQAPADLLIECVGPQQRRLHRVSGKALRGRVHIGRCGQRVLPAAHACRRRRHPARRVSPRWGRSAGATPSPPASADRAQVKPTWSRLAASSAAPQ